MLKDEWIGLFDALRSCVFSPTGLNILAQGKAKRRPWVRNLPHHYPHFETTG